MTRCSTGVRAPSSRAATVLFLQVQHRARPVAGEEKGRGWGVGRPASASSPGTPRRCPETKMRIQNTRRCDRKHTPVGVLQLVLRTGEHVARVIRSMNVSACVVCVPACARRSRAVVWKQTPSFWTNVSFIDPGVAECATSAVVDWVSACVVPPCADCSPDKVISFLLFGKNKSFSEADLLHSVDKQ